MNDPYSGNREQAETYREEISEHLRRRIRPEEIAGPPGAESQPFYLACKSRLAPFVKERVERHKQELRQSTDCHLILLKQTALVDAVAQTSLDLAIWLYQHNHPEDPAGQDIPVAIAARGGYGRQEVYFASNIDIQIVYKTPPGEFGAARIKKVIKHFEYLFIYQEFFRTSSSFGFTEVNRQAKEIRPSQIPTFFSLLEHRRAAGNPFVYSEFKSHIKTAALLHKDEILTHARGHKSYYDVANTVFKQEPNVKDEFRRLYWALALCRLRESIPVTNQFELLYHLFQTQKLSGPAFKNMQNALNFLARVRLFLHCYQKGSQRDALTYEVREKIAESMGYGLKKFYEEYFYKCVYPLKRYSRNLFWERITFDRKAIKNLSGSFAVNSENQIICQQDPEALLEKNPELIFRIISWTAEKGCYLSLPIIRAIERNVDQMSPIFLSESKTGEVHQYFKTIIKGKYFARALRLLHEFGLLANFYIPEFKKLCGLLQDIYVHQFPTDIHILAALDNLNRLELDKNADSFLTGLYQSLRDKTALKLAVLLHDIGKGAKKEGENEELVGSRMVPGILHDLGYRDKTKKTRDVAFLVQKHLMMRDLMLLDPEEDDTYEMVWDLVNYDKERLKMLILLTYADRGGTKMNLSSSQIQQLKLFYQHTLYQRKRNQVPQWVKSEYIKMVRLPRDLQIQMEVYHEFVKSADRFACDLIFKPEQSCELVICTRDNQGLLFEIGAVLAFNQLNVVEADINTLDKKVFDVFKFLNINGQPIDYPEFFSIQKRVKEDLHRIYVKQEPLHEVYRGKKLVPPRGADQLVEQDIKLKLSIIGRAIKLETPDVLGTFMIVTRLFFESKMQIQRAVLHSQDGTASNVFYLRPENVEWIIQNEKQFINRIREGIGLLIRGEPIPLQAAGREKPPEVSGIPVPREPPPADPVPTGKIGS